MKLLKKALSVVLSAAIMLSGTAVLAEDTENVVLSTTEATTLRASEQVMTGAFKVSTDGNTDEYARIHSKTEGGTVEFSFKTAYAQTFDLSFVGVAQFGQNGGLSKMNIQIDDGEAEWLDRNTNVTLGAEITTGENAYGIKARNVQYKNKLTLEAGTHTIKFIVDEVGVNTSVYAAALVSITLTPPELPKVSTTELTTLRASEQIMTGAFAVSTDGSTDEYVSINTKTEGGTVEFKFKTTAAQTFDLSFVGVANFGQNGGLSKMNIQIDDGEAEWLDRNTNVTLGDEVTTGENAYGIKVRNVKYKKKLTLEAGTHTIKFIVDEVGSTTSRYAAALVSITLTPPELPKVSTAEPTTLRASEQVMTGDFAVSTDGNTDEYAKIHSKTEGGTVEFKFKTTAEQTFDLSFVGVSQFGQNGGLSKMNIQIDDGEAEWLDRNTNVTLGDEVTTGENAYGIKVRNVQYKNKLTLEAGTHTIKFIVDEVGVNTSVYAAALVSITLTPPITELDGSENTVLNAADYIDGSGTNIVSGGSDSARYVMASDEASPAMVVIPFVVSKGQNFKFRVDTNANIGDSSDTAYCNLSELGFKIDDSDEIITLSSSNTSIIGNGLHTHYAASRILEYISAFPMEAGMHTITFVSGSDELGYRASVGDITFIPYGASVTEKAVSYVSSTGYEACTLNPEIAVTYSTPGSITVPFNVLADGYYELVMDLYAYFAEGDNASPVYMQLDNGENILISSENTTLTEENVTEYPNVGMLNEYSFNEKLLLTAGRHTVTFSVTDASGTVTADGAALYPSAIGNVSLMEIVSMKSIVISGFNSEMNVGDKQLLQLYSAEDVNFENALRITDMAEVVYSSSDESVAMVDENGLVTASGNGYARITAVARQFETDSYKLTAGVDVYVFDNNICVYNMQKSDNGVTSTLRTKKNITDALLIIAKYDSDGLKGVAVDYRDNVSANEEIELKADFGAVKENEYVKVFVWNSVNYAPLMKSLKYTFTSILCWGDSLTAGAGGNGTSYPGVVAENIANSTYTVQNMGVGGETAYTIAGRQGAIPMTVNAFTIPADTTKTKISFANEKTVRPLLQGGGSTINPCYINGVEGSIIYECSVGGATWVEGDSQYYFKRSEAGEETAVEQGAIVTTSSMNSRRGDIMILFVGTNGPSDTEELISVQKKMIEYNGSDKYLVIGLTTGSAATRAEMEAAMVNEYGDKYLNLREYMSSREAFYDAGFEPSESDASLILSGIVSERFLVDSVHFNPVGYRLIGDRIYKKIKELGYIK